VITGTGSDYKDFMAGHRSMPQPEGYLPKPVDQNEILELIARLTSN
jgi:hypothetical protein